MCVQASQARLRAGSRSTFSECAGKWKCHPVSDNAHGDITPFMTSQRNISSQRISSARSPYFQSATYVHNYSLRQFDPAIIMEIIIVRQILRQPDVSYRQLTTNNMSALTGACGWGVRKSKMRDMDDDAFPKLKGRILVNSNPGITPRRC